MMQENFKEKFRDNNWWRCFSEWIIKTVCSSARSQKRDPGETFSLHTQSYKNQFYCSDTPSSEQNHCSENSCWMRGGDSQDQRLWSAADCLHGDRTRTRRIRWVCDPSKRVQQCKQNRSLQLLLFIIYSLEVGKISVRLESEKNTEQKNLLSVGHVWKYQGVKSICTEVKD